MACEALESAGESGDAQSRGCDSAGEWWREREGACKSGCWCWEADSVVEAESVLEGVKPAAGCGCGWGRSP
jgi:hypothetical protein